MEHIVKLGAGDSVKLLAPEAMGAVSISLEHFSPAVAGDIVIHNVITSLPVNPKATNPAAWWERTPSDIRGITIHHTGCDSPEQAARILLNKGRPTTEYAYFVQYDGSLYQCLEDTLGVWHDHTGHYNRNISIGLAGYWHKKEPSMAQLEGLARLVDHLMRKYNLPLSQVQGHRQRAKEAANVGTECPGWESAGWKQHFFDVLATIQAERQ